MVVSPANCDLNFPVVFLLLSFLLFICHYFFPQGVEDVRDEDVMAGMNDHTAKLTSAAR